MPESVNMDKPEGDHDYDYYFLLTVTNVAMLQTTYTYQVLVGFMQLKNVNRGIS